HGAVVVAEVAQQPPEPFGAAHVPVGDDEDAVAHPGPRGGAGEILGTRQRVTRTRPWRRGEVLVHVEKRRSGDMPGEVELAALSRRAELPAAVDELVAQGARNLPDADTCDHRREWERPGCCSAGFWLSQQGRC